MNSLNVTLPSLYFDIFCVPFWSLVFFVTTVDVLSGGVKGCVGWRLSLLKCRGSSGGWMLSHGRRISWTCKTKWRDRLGPLTVVATCVCVLSRKRCWVSKSSWSNRYRIRSKTRGGRWEVAVTWSPSSSTWVRPSSPTRLMAGKFERHNDQRQLYVWVNSKADVQIHLGKTYRNTLRTKISLDQKWTIVTGTCGSRHSVTIIVNMFCNPNTVWGSISLLTINVGKRNQVVMSWSADTLFLRTLT